MLIHPTGRSTVRLRLLQCPTRLSAKVPPASRVPPPPEGHQKGARKRRTGGTSSSTNQTAPVSTDRLESPRIDSRLIASLEGEFRPYTRREDPPTLMRHNQVSEAEDRGVVRHALAFDLLKNALEWKSET